MVRCNVKGCTRTQKQDKNHSFFSEPKNLMIRKQWRKFAGITNNPKDFRICSDHFELSCYRKRTPPRWLLYREAVPTIRMGEDHSYASSAGTHSSSNASATISSPTPYQPSPTSTIRTSDQPSISASIDYSHNSVTLNTADKATMYVQENVSSSSTPVFSESIPKNFNNFNTIGICSSPVSSKLSSLNAKVSPNSRSQQSSRLLMTSSKKVSRVPRTLVFKNSTVPPKEAVTSPSKLHHMKSSTSYNQLRIRNKVDRQVQLTPKSSRIKIKIVC
ncbi:uncharacterized serine-rich protein C215.13-like [Chrysoperla carnea]|uniref:uncharacterized serine-rich protein C215.13-like n=1 Tax=Chrysoperla carnea TaxID=189513 RepID=UPI001D068057|nr:uncharacterized serine-rich protein C215.13-like [Chrysoperla carnea]